MDIPDDKKFFPLCLNTIRSYSSSRRDAGTQKNDIHIKESVSGNPSKSKWKT
jgi:hypothetical protein